MKTKVNHLLRNGMPEWNATTAYEAGDWAKYQGNQYKCIVANTGDTPPGTSWQAGGIDPEEGIDQSSVQITGGSISGINDLAVADGGTGASTPSAARNNLGLKIGEHVQAYSENLTNFADKTAPSGDVVGTSGNQTLSNKTLASPTLTGTTVGATFRVGDGAPSSPSYSFSNGVGYGMYYASTGLCFATGGVRRLIMTPAGEGQVRRINGGQSGLCFCAFRLPYRLKWQVIYGGPLAHHLPKPKWPGWRYPDFGQQHLLQRIFRARLKDDFRSIDDSGTIIDALKVYSYRFRSEPTGGRMTGVVAQEDL